MKTAIPGAHIRHDDQGLMARLTPDQHKQALAQLLRGLKHHLRTL